MATCCIIIQVVQSKRRRQKRNVKLVSTLPVQNRIDCGAEEIEYSCNDKLNIGCLSVSYICVVS